MPRGRSSGIGGSESGTWPGRTAVGKKKKKQWKKKKRRKNPKEGEGKKKQKKR